ncbi:MAG: hypothetical protein AB7V27_07830 [Candidatus Binatia bacterium]
MAVKRTKKSGKRGQIGTEIFDQVEKLVAAEQVGRTEAFRRLAQKTGRQPGTVAANYYRVARQRGAKLATRRRGGGRRGSATSVVVKRALAALEDVTGLFRRLEDEITNLRKENLRLAAIRRLMSR